ncbi:hypothetical protein JAAARDRAFT_656427 [Jaapia argillacea MUCL 33604]|uniref:Ribonuclease n=1 Tax=Jaapia argillacea MUCL 33604 TaxID=933084 RepID=A0A067PWN8_9AGAM|nr:hypothetical protein JAAARDRAFT_656427 [Jaapia argillacea MUCL 33604]
MSNSQDSEPGPSRIPSIPNPNEPLSASYTFHTPTPTAPGPYILGVDEAGRGPVLGPLVYGVAYCVASFQETLEQMAFADSKQLTAKTRDSLLGMLSSDPENMGWSVRVLCPQAISSGMLRRPPLNLNRQSEDATVLLIREVLQRGLQLSEVYVDTLGNPLTYQNYLSSMFPGINFTVAKKADDLYKIVGAASIAAKVTRDAWIDGWVFEEDALTSRTIHSDDIDSTTLGEKLGSGYPGDPNTVKWLSNTLEPTFGFPSLARFSWATIKTILEKRAHHVKWIDEGQESLVKAFDRGSGEDKDRCTVTKDLGITSLCTL